MIIKKKKKLKNLIRFHSANKIDNYNRGRKREKKGKTSKRNCRTRQNIRIVNIFQVTAVCILSLTRSHSPPHPPRVPSNNAPVSGPAVGADQTLIWSYSCVFLPPMCTDIKTSAFSFVGALNVLVYIPWTQSLPSSSCGFNLQLA